MLVTFDVAGQEFALDLEAVQEILPAPATRGGTARGSARARGDVAARSLLPLLSLRVLLGFPPAAGVGRARKSGRHEGRRALKSGWWRTGRARLLLPPTFGDRRDSARARGSQGGEVAHQSHISRRGRPKADLDSRARAVVPGGCDAAIERSAATEDDDARTPSHDARARRAQFLVFRLGDDEFALPIDAVDEVAQVPATDHASAEDAEIPGGRRQSARRRAARDRPTPPLRHAGARANTAAAARRGRRRTASGRADRRQRVGCIADSRATPSSRRPI